MDTENYLFSKNRRVAMQKIAVDRFVLCQAIAESHSIPAQTRMKMLCSLAGFQYDPVYTPIASEFVHLMLEEKKLLDAERKKLETGDALNGCGDVLLKDIDITLVLYLRTMDELIIKVKRKDSVSDL